MMGNVVEQVKWKEVITDIMMLSFYVGALCSVITMAGFTIKGSSTKGRYSIRPHQKLSPWGEGEDGRNENELRRREVSAIMKELD